jgi:hypothetical protein
MILIFAGAISLFAGILVGIGYLIGWQTGRQHGREESDELHRSDSTPGSN